MKWPSLLRFESANTLAGLELVRQQKRLGNTDVNKEKVKERRPENTTVVISILALQSQKKKALSIRNALFVAKLQKVCKKVAKLRNVCYLV